MIGLLAFRLDGRWTAMSSRTTRKSSRSMARLQWSSP